MPIEKTNLELAETMKETPVKIDDAEIEIHETPSVVKSIEKNSTNLSDKISQIINKKKQEELKILQIKAKENTIRTTEQSFKSKVMNNAPTSQLIDVLPKELQQRALKLKNELIEKPSTSKVVVKKNELEVQRAIESINNLTNQFGNQTNYVLQTSGENDITVDNVLDTSSNKKELLRAVESISTKSNDNDQDVIGNFGTKKKSQFNKKVHDASSKSNEKSKIPVEKSMENVCRTKLTDSITTSSIFCTTYIEPPADTKKKRRKYYKDEDLTIIVYDDEKYGDNNEVCQERPTNYESIFDLPPVKIVNRKKRNVGDSQTIKNNENSSSQKQTADKSGMLFMIKY